MSEYPWLLLAVYVVTVGTVQLLALWAATSTRPWLLRALAVWTPILLLILIRATWPALFLFMSAAQTIGFSFLIERFCKERRPNGALPARWRFRLADLLVVMLFLGTWLALASKIVPLAHQASLLLFVGLAALPLALLAILARGMVPGPWRATMGVVALGLVWTCAVLMRLGNAPLFLGEGRPSLGTSWSREEAFWAASDGLFPLAALVCFGSMVAVWRRRPDVCNGPIASRVLFGSIAVGLGVAIPLVWIVWDGFGWWIVPDKFWQHNLEVGIHSIFFSALAGFLVVVTWLIRAAADPVNQNLRIGAKRSLLALAVLLGLPGIWLYWQMLWYAPFPKLKSSPENHYGRVVEIAKRSARYIHTDRNKMPAAVAAELDEAVLLLRQHNHVPQHMLESRWNPETGLSGHDMMALTGRFWEAGESSVASKGFDQAADYGVAIIRFDAIAVLAEPNHFARQGYELLTEYRDEFSPAKARDVIGLLQQTLAERNEPSVLAAFRRARWERDTGWHYKLRTAMALPSGVPYDYSSTEADGIREARKFWDTWNLLLQTELAIGLFRRQHGKLPASIAELVPEYLPKIPIDPYKGDALSYRLDGVQYTLYSIGPNGSDDGGEGSPLLQDRPTGSYGKGDDVSLGFSGADES